MRLRQRLPVVFAMLLLYASNAIAFELRVSLLRPSAPRVALVMELRDLLRDKFLETIRQNRSVFLQVQAELWEDRRITDRLVLTTPEVIYRIDRVIDRGVSVTDEYGNRSSLEDLRSPLPISIDLGALDRLTDDGSYYVHGQVTAATVAERSIDQLGAAIFGDDQSAAGLANLGRYLFRTVMRIGRYMDSASAEVTSQRYTGVQIRTGAR